MTTKQRERLLTAQKLLLRWHDKNARRFSWRKKVRAPYNVFLCEMMGQQTQATRIQEYLGKFLNAFPTPAALATAKQSEVIKLWQGLGYNRRAINLHKAANQIVAEHNGKLPSDYDSLLALPGVGPYSANAILVFAFQKPVAAIDINVSRVITRISKKATHEELLPKEKVEEICAEILPIKSVRSWHEAVMDLGATICTKRNPKCNECPINSACASNTLYLRSKKDIPVNRGIEVQHFGHPKRIWRGRILKFITSNTGVSKKELRSYLISEFNASQAEAATLITLVLPELQAEGFISIKNDKLTLA